MPLGVLFTPRADIKVPLSAKTGSISMVCPAYLIFKVALRTNCTVDVFFMTICLVTDAMFPVWITVLYLVLGFVFGLWHPGWLVFLAVPIHYMHFDSQWERLTNPVTVTLIYLVLGFFFGLWHPGWLVFLAIPLGEMYKS